MPAVDHHHDRRVERGKTSSASALAISRKAAAAAAPQLRRRQRRQPARAPSAARARPPSPRTAATSAPNRRAASSEKAGSRRRNIPAGRTAPAGQHEAEDDQQQPDRRGTIAHDADGEMHAARPCQSVRCDDPEMLQVALRPTPVAHGGVDQRRRAFFPRAAEVGRHLHAPAGAAHQRRLDEIVRQDRPAERLPAGQLRQAAGRQRRPPCG